MYPSRDGAAQPLPTPGTGCPVPAPSPVDAAGRRWPRSRSSVPGSTNQTLSAQAFFFPLLSPCDPAPRSLHPGLPYPAPCPRPLAEGRRVPLEVAEGGPCPVGVRSSPGPSRHRAAPGGAWGGERRGSWGAGTRGCSWAMSLAATEDPCPLALPALVQPRCSSQRPSPAAGGKKPSNIFAGSSEPEPSAADRPPAPVATANSPWPGFHGCTP